MTDLSICQLTKLFPTPKGRIVAVDNVSLTLTEGHSIAFVGESGSGKTTLARMIAGLEKPSHGKIELPSTWKPHPGGAGPVQMIFQNPQGSLNPRLTIKSSLIEAIHARDKQISQATAESEAQEWLRTVALAPEYIHRHPHEFSGGQRQRIALARALAARPKLLIADEPTSALDVSIQAQMLTLLRNLIREQGLTLILITHNLHVAAYLCQELFVMQAGKIVERGPAAKLLSQPQHSCTRDLVNSLPSAPRSAE